MSRFTDDLRTAVRALRARPTFLVTAVLTLALGIGALAAIFTVYDAVLLKPLPFAHPERIVRVMRDQPPVTHSPVSPPVFREWQARSGEAFEAFGAFVGGTYNLTGSGDADRLSGYAVTPGFWNVFNGSILQGRAFGEAEENANERVAVIGEALWRDRFGADAGVIGRDVVLNGEAWRVVGVARADASFPSGAQLWVPTFLPGNTQVRGNNSLSIVARLRDGVGTQQALGVLDGIVQWQRATWPGESKGMQVRVEALQDRLTSRVREPLGMLFGAAGLVLLIACANLANLMLARGQARAQELALRSALGAGRGRLVRAVLAESMVVAALGTLAGVLAAIPAVRGLLALAPDLLPAYAVPAVDLRVVAACAGGALATLLLFGLLPAWRASRIDPAAALQGASRSQTGGAKQVRARGVLVAGEVALAVALLAGAGLLIDSLRRLGEVDSGVDPKQVLTAQFSLPAPSMEAGEDIADWYARMMAFAGPRLDAIEARLREIPGVESVALSERLPASGDWGWNGSFGIVGHELPEDAIIEFRFASTDYFRTYGIPVKAGRAFDEQDGHVEGVPTQVVVNQAVVDRYLAGGDALGRQITALFGDPKAIIGVVGDVRQAGLDRPPNAELYFPIRKVGRGELALGLKVRGDAMAVAGALREAMREVAPDVPVYAIRTLESVTGATLQLRRFNMTLMSVFAGVALVLAAIGLYGVVAYTVGQRRREIGLRQAIGADTRDIHRLVLGTGMRMVVPGLVAGIVGAIALGRVISAQLYGVGAADPRVLAGVVAVLALVAFAACAVPMWRAARVAPMEALRAE